MEKYLDELADARSHVPKKKAENQFIEDYALKMDETHALEHDLESWYQSLIGMIRWMLEIGRFDIITEVSMMVSQISMHR